MARRAKAPSPRGSLALTAAVGASSLGDWLALVPLALAFEAAGSGPAAVAALFAALWAPSVALAGAAGSLVDRVGPAGALLAASLAQAAASAALAVTHGAAPAPVLLLVAALGSGHAVAQPAEFALAPAVAGSGGLREVTGRLEAARYAGFAAGPLAGGALAAAGGTPAALALNAVSFLGVAAVAARLRAAPAAMPNAASGRAREGIVLLARDRVLAPLLGVIALSLVFMTAVATAEVFFATDELRAGALGYAALTATWAAAMAAGCLLAAPRVPAGAVAGGALAATAVQGAGIALPAVWPVLAFAVACYGAGGLAHGTKTVLVRSLIHERVPPSHRGRAFAAYNGLRNGAELVALGGSGLLVAAAGPRLTMLLAGGLPVAVALAALIRLHLPHRPQEAPMSRTDVTLARFEDADDVLGSGYPGELRFLAEPLGLRQVAVSYRRMPPRTGGKNSYGHRHRTQEEVVVVIAGRVQLKLDDDVVELAAGAAARIAPEVARSIWNDGPETAELLLVSTRIADLEADVELVDGFWPAAA